MGSLSILVVNQRGRLHRTELQHLEEEGHIVRETSIGFKPPAWTEDGVYDLFILNLNDMLIDVEQCARWIPPRQQIPVMVLIGCLDPNRAVDLLNAGADDILPRPFFVREMMARIRAVVRRAQRNYTLEVDKPHTIQLSDLTIHMTGRRVFVQDREVRLTRTEFNLLSTLVDRLDKVCSHSELLARVWGWEYCDATQYLYVYMGRLRRKLGDGYGAILETVPGIGYVLHSDADASVA